MQLSLVRVREIGLLSADRGDTNPSLETLSITVVPLPGRSDERQ